MSANSEAMKRWRAENPDYMHNWYIRNRETLLARGRQWRIDNKERMDYLNKRNYEFNGESIRASVKGWAEENPEKVVAQNAFRKKVISGEIERPEACSRCGLGSVRIVGHHEDYSKPFEVIWLCVSCHKRIHAGTLVLVP